MYEELYLCAHQAPVFYSLWLLCPGIDARLSCSPRLWLYPRDLNLSICGMGFSMSQIEAETICHV